MANQDTNRDININVYDEDPFSFTLNENTIEARIVAVRSGNSGGSEVWVNGTGINSVKTIDATTASGDYSVAEGYATTASGGCSHAEGQSTEAYGDFAHAEGVSTEAGDYSHAEGYGTQAGEYSHAEGYYTNTDHGSHAEGWYTTAYGDCSHGEGYESSASGNVSHSEGLKTESVGDNSHAEGCYSISNGNSSHAEGYDTIADSEASHASGYHTYANAFAMTAVGMNNKKATIVDDDWTANTQYSVGDIVVFTSKNSDDFPVKYTYKCITANSDSTFNSYKWELLHVSDGDIAFAVGNGDGGAGASGCSNAMSVYWNGDAEFSGKVTVGANPSNNMDVATKQYVDTAVGGVGGCLWDEGTGTNAVKMKGATTAIGNNSIAEGSGTTARGLGAHAEGINSVAQSDGSHAEGYVSYAHGNYSHAEGTGTNAYGSASHAEGSGTKTGTSSGTTDGTYAHAEGGGTTATGNASHAEGLGTTASGYCSHSEGASTTASGGYSHAEGGGTTASGNTSHAEGSGCTATGFSSHAEGLNTTAAGADSHAEGNSSTASGVSSHAGGYFSIANGHHMTAIGTYNNGATISPDWVENTSYSVGDIVVHGDFAYKCITANSDSTFTSSKWEAIYLSNGDTAFAIGNGINSNNRSNAMRVDWFGNTEIAGKLTVGVAPTNNMDVATKQYVDTAVAGGGGECLWNEGTGTNSVMMKAATGASGNNSIAEGIGTTASGNYSHAEGNGSTAGSESSHAEGANTVAQNINAHAEGGGSRAYGVSSHAEGSGTNAYGNYSHTEGGGTTTGVSSGTTTGEYSHAEGSSTTSTGTGSHSEGGGSSASGNFSHAEGASTTANAVASHAEGNGTRATGNQSHAEGSGCIASGNQSHAEGGATTANANQAHSEGGSTIASGISSHAEGVSTRAAETGAHAEGLFSVASGVASHASGYYTAANCDNMTAIGAYNLGATINTSWARNTSYSVGDIVTYDGITYKCITANSDSTFISSKWEILYCSNGDTAFVIGNGTNTSNSQRSNAMRVDWYGNTEIGGKLTVGSAPTNNMDVATKQYVDNAVSGGGSSSNDPIINTVNGNYVTIVDVKENDTPITCLVDIDCSTSGTPNWNTPVDIYGACGTKIYHHGIECCPRFITIATDSNGDWQTDTFAGVKSGVKYALMLMNPTSVTNDISVYLKYRGNGIETNILITTFTPVASNVSAVAFTPNKSGDIYLSGSFGSSYANRTYSPLAYMNINKLKSPHSEYEAKTYTPFDWSSTAGNIYGGELNVLTGELSVTKNLITLDGTISPDSIISHLTDSLPTVEAVYNANNQIFTKTPLASRHYIVSDRINSVTYSYSYNYNQNAYIDNNGALHVGVATQTATVENINSIFASKPTKIVYKVAEPTVYNVTPINIEFLEDDNIIFSEFGDITIVYQATVKKYINEIIAEKIEENNNTYGIQYYTVSGISATVAAGDTYTVQYSFTDNQLAQIKNADYFILISQDNRVGNLDFVKAISKVGRRSGGSIFYYSIINSVTKDDAVFSMSFDVVFKNTTDASVTITNGSIDIGFLRKIIVRDI